jgi:hypothetical protein
MNSYNTNSHVFNSYETNSYDVNLYEINSYNANSYNDMNSYYTNSYVLLCVFVPDKERYCLTDSHIELNSLDDTQECLSNSHHKMSFDYDEDTMS